MDVDSCWWRWWWRARWWWPWRWKGQWRGWWWWWWRRRRRKLMIMKMTMNMIMKRIMMKLMIRNPSLEAGAFGKTGDIGRYNGYRNGISWVYIQPIYDLVGIFNHGHVNFARGCLFCDQSEAINLRPSPDHCWNWVLWWLPPQPTNRYKQPCRTCTFLLEDIIVSEHR